MSKQLIGISIGSQGSVIGTLKGKIVDVILSDSSNREVPTVVAYGDRERTFGDAALSTAKSNFKRTVISPNRWLGLQRDWPFIEEEAKYANIKPTFDSHNKVGFEIMYKGEKKIYTSESLMGLYFEKLKKNWHREGIDTKEVVVSIPDYCTVHERKAMLEALQIADLNCTALINESSAISLAYGLLRLREFDEKKPRVVGFVDMGQAKTTVFFGTFTQKLMKVVSVSSERFCGAREFDYIIAEHVAKDFEAKYEQNPMKNQKCKLRLLDAVAKIRKMLTVNKEGTISVDSLMDGEDLVYHLTKDEFEKLIQPVMDKFTNLCKVALEKLKTEAKYSLQDLHSIEMVGDAVRTPIVQKVIKDVFGKDISKTLIPDECISRGCALYAAMNSPFFTIMNFSFEHYNPYSIILEYPFLKNGEVQTRTHKIIAKGENIPGKKSIKFTEQQTPRQDIIPLKLYYDKEELPWMPNTLLKGFNVEMPKNIGEKFTFALQFILDLNCLPALSKASIDEVYYEEVPVKVAEAPKKEEPKKEEKKEEEKSEEKKEPEKPKEAEKPKTEKVKKEKSTNCTLNTVDTLYGTTQGILDQFLQLEVTQETDDKVFHIASHKKNELEQFIYNTREKFNHNFKDYVTPEEKDALTKLMDALLEWLYSDDEQLYNKSTLDLKSKDMMELGKVLYTRFDNWTKLEESIQLFEKGIEKINIAVKAESDKLANKQQTYLTPSDFEAIDKLVKDAVAKVQDAKTKYGQGIKTQEPLIKHEDVSNGLSDLKSKVTKIYQDAEFKVKEAERKKKEEEEKKKREEEEKKKKEAEEKKKKEEEEKKKKEAEDKKDNKDDVKMKDVTEEKKEEKKDPNAMDVE